MSANVNTTTNGTELSGCNYNPTVGKIGKTFAYCLISVVSLAGNILIGIIVYKMKPLRKPINFLIVNMAMSDVLFPIFLIPPAVARLDAGSWLISGPLGQAFTVKSQGPIQPLDSILALLNRYRSGPFGVQFSI